MPQPRPLISVLVATYNGAAFLDETLDSVRAQTYRNLEIIVRDDGSADDSLAIAARHAEQDHRIRVLSAETRGGSGFTNHIELARLARGVFVKYCNQDDLLDPTCVNTLARPMIAHPQIALASSSRRLIDATGAELPPRIYTAPLHSQTHVLGGRSVIGHVLRRMVNQIGEPSTTMFRRRLVDPDTMWDFAGTTFRVNCDLALWFSLLTRGALYWHATPLSSFRLHDAQFSASRLHVLAGNVEWVDLLAGGIDLGVLDDYEAAELADRLAVGLQDVVDAAEVDDSLTAAERDQLGPLRAAVDRARQLNRAVGSRRTAVGV